MKELFIGIDSGWELHCLLILDADGNEITYREVPTRTDSLVELRDYLFTLGERPENIHLAIEDPKQPLVDVLIEAGFSMWSINPKQTDRLREVRWNAKAKDDRRDALVIADELRLRKSLFTRIQACDALTTSLEQLHRFRQDRVAARNAEENQLTQLLRRYFPQYLQLGWAVQERVMLDLLSIAAHPKHLDELSPDDIKTALGRTRKHTPEQVISILKSSPLPLPDDLLDEVSAMIKMRAQAIRFHNEHIHILDKKIAQTTTKMDQKGRSTNTPSDIQILLSIPGVGPYILAVLLAEASTAIEQRDLDRLRLQSIAPVTSRTGNQGRKSAKKSFSLAPVHRRFHGNRELQDALYHLGRVAPQNSPHYKKRYTEMRERGHTHGRACRQIADQILTVMFAMLRNKTLYDPAMHGATRRQTN